MCTVFRFDSHNFNIGSVSSFWRMFETDITNLNKKLSEDYLNYLEAKGDLFLSRPNILLYLW